MLRVLGLSVILLVSLNAASQDYLSTANKCYNEKNYQCAFDNYKKAFEDKKYHTNDHALILYKMGYSLSILQKYEESIPYFKDAISSKPSMSEAHWSLARSYFDMKEYELASEYYGKAIEFYKSDNNTVKTLYYQRGRSYSLLNKHADALTYYKMAIAIDSNVADYHARAGDATYALKQYNDAIKYYQKSILLGDEDKKIMSARYYWVGKANFELRKFDEALRAFKGALEYNPESKNAHWSTAAVYYNQEKWPESVAQYTKTMTYYQSDTASMKDLLFYRGRSYNSNKEYAKAMADFDAIIKLDPNYKSAYWQKASSYYFQKKYKEAIPHYTKVMEVYKDDNSNLDDATYWRGYCYLQIKDTANARADFIKAISLNKNLTDPNIQMGHISFADRKYFEAKDYYGRSAASYNADSSELTKVWFRKGLSNLLTGNNSLAKTDLEKSVRYDSLNKEAHRYLGEVNFLSNYFNVAKAEFDKCIQLYKNVKDSLPRMYAYRGMAYSKLAKYAEALADYEQADKLKPNTIDYVQGIGQLAFETKDYNKVISSFTKLISLYKPAQTNELAFAYYARGRAYYELKDKAKAKADLEKAMDLVPTYAEAQRWLEAVNKMQ